MSVISKSRRHEKPGFLGRHTHDHDFLQQCPWPGQCGTKQRFGFVLDFILASLLLLMSPLAKAGLFYVYESDMAFLIYSDCMLRWETICWLACSQVHGYSIVGFMYCGDIACETAHVQRWRNNNWSLEWHMLPLLVQQYPSI